VGGKGGGGGGGGGGGKGGGGGGGAVVGGWWWVGGVGGVGSCFIGNPTRLPISRGTCDSPLLPHQFQERAPLGQVMPTRVAIANFPHLGDSSKKLLWAGAAVQRSLACRGPVHRKPDLLNGEYCVVR